MYRTVKRFLTEMPGFRKTLLENNDEKRRQTYNILADAIRTYLG